MMRRLIIMISATFFWSVSASAMTFKAYIKRNEIQWKDVVEVDNNTFTPSFWYVESGLKPTREWIPGGLTATSPSEVRLTSGNESVVLPLTVSGFEYNIGSTNAVLGRTQSGLLCSGNYTAGIVKVIGQAGCLHPHALITTNAYNPYSFIRPLIKIETEKLSKIFEGKPAGYYVGSIAVGSFYDYYLPSSLRTRYHANYQIRFEFNFQPAFVFSVDITGESELKPHYSPKADYVSGESVFNGRASGWFSDGLMMTLNRSRINYEMKGPQLTKIPYSIECLECDTPLLVSKGLVKNYTATVQGNRTEEIPFRLKVSFTDIDLSTLENGQYNDTFYLIFEPKI
ncbi:hypothetical protein [Vibrio salilacus]|uniref:hypothetical protein n=1 Tax=Vibrio salilacus TaxID=1323749 RepID=UPI0012FD2559|nr:hypothetical protein [Vibrio salilacus]